MCYPQTIQGGVGADDDAWRRGPLLLLLKRKGDDKMDKRSIYDEIISALQEFYNEYGNGKPLDYIYGFFDALGVIRDLESANAPVQHIGHPL